MIALGSRTLIERPAVHLAIGLVLGGLVRAVPLLGEDFPLGDGGMFAVMATDIRGAGFALPAFTSYNGGDIPFAYPPLGVYVLALVPDNPVSTERWLPFVWSMLAIYAFWRLAMRIDARMGGFATVAFALLPAAYSWQIMGGGVTRALGLSLGLGALGEIAGAMRQPSVRTAAIAGLLGGLAALAHPMQPALIAVGGVALWIGLSRARDGLLTLAVAAAVAAAVIAPWLVAVGSRHGAEPFVAALAARTAPPPEVLAVGIALLLGWGLRVAIDHAGRWRGPFVAAVLVVAFAGSLVSTQSPGSVLYAVPSGLRDRMADVPPGRYAVYTGNPGDDHVVEWFPALTGSVSVGTYQGAEWRGDWAATVARHHRIQDCRCADGAMLWDAR